MTGVVLGPSIEPFFLPAHSGKRFCVFHPAAGAPRGGVVYVPPFAEEMNKARRMAALQSRALASAGFSVLQIDLFGCGDSSGEFAEARWEIWQHDIALGVRWLSDRTSRRPILWGLRLGALLALDSAKHCDPVPKHFILWQPVLSGELLVTQFLRMRLASEMIAQGKSDGGLARLRAQLAAGDSIEIAGYELAASLAGEIEAAKLLDLVTPEGTIDWLEVVSEAGRDVPPAARRVSDAIVRKGISLNIECVPGLPFWNTVETTECPELIFATNKILQRALA